MVPLAWFIRHGESTANAGQPTQSPAATSLTEVGRQQAQDLHLPGPPSLIAVSPFIRTHQTAQPTIERFPNVPVVEWPVQEFIFLNPLNYAGTTENDRRPSVLAYFDRDDPDYIEEGAESFSKLRARVIRVLTLIEEAQSPVAVFTHGRFIQSIRWVLAGRPDSPKAFYEWALQNPVPNATITTLNRRLVPRWLELSPP